MKENLLPCPFCGGQATMQDMNCYASPSTQVRCLNCHCSTQIFQTGYDVFTWKKVTLDDAKARAVRAWNCRRGAASEGGAA